MIIKTQKQGYIHTDKFEDALVERVKRINIQENTDIRAEFEAIFYEILEEMCLHGDIVYAPYVLANPINKIHHNFKYFGEVESRIDWTFRDESEMTDPGYSVRVRKGQILQVYQSRNGKLYAKMNYGKKLELMVSIKETPTRYVGKC